MLEAGTDPGNWGPLVTLDHLHLPKPVQSSGKRGRSGAQRGSAPSPRSQRIPPTPVLAAKGTNSRPATSHLPSRDPRLARPANPAKLERHSVCWRVAEPPSGSLTRPATPETVPCTDAGAPKGAASGSRRARRGHVHAQRALDFPGNALFLT